MDFTLKKYRLLLETFQKKGYSFLTYEEYIERKTSSLPEKFVILRHDVDLHAERSLEMAKIEAELNVCATYYFRVIKQSNQPEIIRQIVQMNHEIGYHYEDLCLCKGNRNLAKNHFQKWLSCLQPRHNIFYIFLTKTSFHIGRIGNTWILINILCCMPLQAWGKIYKEDERCVQ